MAASPALSSDLEAASAITRVRECGGFLLVMNGRLNMFRHQYVPTEVLRDVLAHREAIKLRLLRMAK